MYKGSTLLTEVASELVARFEVVGQHVAKLDTMALMDNEWVEENKKVEHLVLVGKNLGIIRCQSILNAFKETTTVPEDMKIGEALYNHSENQRSSLWGKVAKREEKAARKLVRAIASEVA